MSRILVDQIRSNSASADAMTLDGSGNVTFPANATCSGTATGFGGGKILQVKQTIKTDVYSESLGVGYESASCGLDVDITPSATTSKILIICVANVANSDSIETATGLNLYRGGSGISGAQGDGAGSRGRVASQSYTENAGYSCQAISLHYLDSPSSTSQQTYSVRLKYFTTSSAETIYLNRTRDDDAAYYRGRAMSTITAMEIGA